MGIPLVAGPMQSRRYRDHRRSRPERPSRDFGNGVAAARAHLLHLHLMSMAQSVPAGFNTNEDPRWDAALAAGFAGIASKLADLTNTWARDDDYAEKIARRLNNLEREAIFGRGGPNPQPRPLGQKPYVLLVSGHRSRGDGAIMSSGNSPTTWLGPTSEYSGQQGTKPTGCRRSTRTATQRRPLAGPP